MSGLAVILQNVNVLNAPVQATAQSFCSCAFRCAFTEYAFAGTNDYDSDKSSFLFKKIGASDTVTIELYKAGELKATITDNTYGTYYSSFTAQPKYVGFVADWALIKSAFEAGFYTIKATLNILGETFTEESRQFNVMDFDEKTAHTTVKIESFQSGVIIGNEFDFTDLIPGGWYESMRLPVSPNGFKLSSDRQEDRYFNSSYDQIQNRETARRFYEVNFRLIPDSIHHKLISTEQLANYLRISNYDLFSDQDYENIEVVVEEVGESERHAYGRQNFTMVFKDRRENLIKRNV